MAKLKNPVILNGKRGGRESEDKANAQQEQELAQSVSALSSVQKNEEYDGKAPVTFTSRWRRHRIQITSPADQFEPSTGKILRGRPVVAQFDNFTFTTSDKMIVNALRKTAKYGIEVFESAIVQAATEDAIEAQVLSAIEANPALRRRVTSVLEGKSFPNPKATAGAGA